MANLRRLASAKKALLLLGNDIETNPGMGGRGRGKARRGPQSRRGAKQITLRRGQRLSLVGKGPYSLGDAWAMIKKYGPAAVGGGFSALGGLGFDKGWNAGREISQARGWGPYRAGLRGKGPYSQPWSVNRNSLTTNGNIPRVDNIRDAGMRVSHEEFFDVVTSSTGFTVNSYSLNPGLSRTFPWFNKLAGNFQQWKLNGCLVTFKSSMSNATASFTSLGTVAIAVNLNPAEPAPISETEIEQLKFCAVAKSSEDIVAPIECDRQSTPVSSYYVRNTTPPSNASIMDYDHGTLYVASYAAPTAGVVLGRLFISYDISLLNPRFVMQANNAYASYALVTPTLLTTLGATTPVKYTDNIGLTFPAGATTGYFKDIVFPVGTYGTFIIQIMIANDSAKTWGGAPTYTFTNCAAGSGTKPWLTTAGARGASNYTPYGTATSTYMNALQTVDITDTAVQAKITVDYNAGITLGSTYYATLNVYSLPGTPTVAPVTVNSSAALAEEKEEYFTNPPPDDEEDYNSVLSGPTSSAAAAAAGPSALKRPSVSR